MHTTGMDIKQCLDATAACTLGKDMTLRDHAQGVYRMRGLGRGQTIVVLVVDEVRELILEAIAPKRDCSAAMEASTLPSHWESAVHAGPRGEADVQARRLEDVLAWLLLNSMASEHLQSMQLCNQCLHNVWRRRAFARLLTSEAPPTAGAAGDLSAARGGIAAEDEEDEAVARLNDGLLGDATQDEPMLITRFVREPLDAAKLIESTHVAAQESLSAEEMAVLELRCRQQHVEVLLHCSHGRARTSYTRTSGAYAVCDDGPCYLLAHGRSPMTRSKPVELRVGRWAWEVLIEKLPDDLRSGQLHVGVMDERKKSKDHAGFIFDLERQETRVVQWTKEQRPKGECSSDIHELQSGTCLALMLDIPSPDEKPPPPKAMYPGASFIAVGAGDPQWNGLYVVDTEVGNIADAECYVKMENGVRCEMNTVNRTSDGVYYFSKGHENTSEYYVDGEERSDGLYFPPLTGWEVSDGTGPAPHLVVEGGALHGTLSLLLRKGPTGDSSKALEESVTNLPLGRGLTPYVVWIPGKGREPIHLMLLASETTMRLFKDSSYHPIESQASGTREASGHTMP